MRGIHMIMAGGITAAVAGCIAVAAMAYDAVAEHSHAGAVSASQQAKLDALVEQM